MAIKNNLDGFSKLSKEDKIKIVASYTQNPDLFVKTVNSFSNSNPKIQQSLDEFSENTIGNYSLPLGIAPHFVINGKEYVVPMVTEESSVVAAASGAAKFWKNHGGFKAEVKQMTKVGHIHFFYYGNTDLLISNKVELISYLLSKTDAITANMKKRGGGILSADFVDKTSVLPNYFQLEVKFDTKDAMGANFINSCLEILADEIRNFDTTVDYFAPDSFEVIMAILSNYTPECTVKAWVELSPSNEYIFDKVTDNQTFINRFIKAVDIAKADVYRATTHNKGIYNGIDSVILATGNDFRAIEAAGHSFAARFGKYSSLSSAKFIDNKFTFGLEVPMAVGTVGGLTNLHPLAKYALEILQNPDAKTLMKIAACVGLANNYAAVKSLITSGIQKGHMKMHLLNIIKSLNATETQKQKALIYFKDNVVSYSAVSEFLKSLNDE